MTAAQSEPLQLREVVARDAAGPKGTPRGLLYGVSLDLGATDLAVVGGIEDGTRALAEVLIGRRAPDRGTVRVHGKDPFHTPGIRARIGAVGLEDGLPLARSVGAAVEMAVSARSSILRAGDILVPFGLTALASRSVPSLTADEVRAIELALAFSLQDPALLVLVEPYADANLLGRARIDEELGRFASRCPIVAITSLPADARSFGRSVVLHRGAFVRSADGLHDALAPGAEAGLTVWIARGARGLVSALAKDPSAASLAYDEVAEDRGVLRVSGKDEGALALALADAASAAGASVSAVAPAVPGLAEVRAATEHDLRSRQHMAQRAHALQMQMHGAHPGTQGAPFGTTGYAHQQAAGYLAAVPPPQAPPPPQASAPPQAPVAPTPPPASPTEDPPADPPPGTPGPPREGSS